MLFLNECPVVSCFGTLGKEIVMLRTYRILAFLMITTILMSALVVEADAGRRFRSAATGAAIGAGIGAIVDGGRGAGRGAAVGAIVGAVVR